ncbi:MAG: hypothetical protein LBU32_26335 [Clostridiales bacterium]|nr:hypothetical protein [Clostridiales bacterium]
MRRLFPPSPLQLRERDKREPQRASAPLRGKGAVSTALYAKAADLNNNLHRKILDCRTPAEMSDEELLKTAQGASPSPAPSASTSMGRGKTSLWHLLHLILQFMRLI